MRVLLFVDSLAAGGAERQIVQIAVGLARKGHAADLVTLYPGGLFESQIPRIPGLSVRSLHSVRRPRFFERAGQLGTSVRRLRRVINESRPDVVYSMLYVSNALAGLALGDPPTAPWVLGLRSDGSETTLKTAAFRALCARLSPRATRVISNSSAGMEAHARLGFDLTHGLVVANGIDADAFVPQPAARSSMRRRLRLPAEAPVIGRVGRLAPAKNHPVFLRAAAALLRTRPASRFVCVGTGPRSYARRLRRLAAKLGLSDKVTWIENCAEMPLIYSVMDVAVSNSRGGEGSPNVIGEAMACGLPCVVTPTGESQNLVGDTGRVVSASSPAQLASAIDSLLTAGSRPDACRRRIVEKFSLASTIDHTEQVLTAAADRGARAR